MSNTERMRTRNGSRVSTSLRKDSQIDVDFVHVHMKKVWRMSSGRAWQHMENTQPNTRKGVHENGRLERI